MRNPGLESRQGVVTECQFRRYRHLTTTDTLPEITFNPPSPMNDGAESAFGYLVRANLSPT